MLIDKQLIIDAKQKLGDKAAYIIAKELQLENFDEKNLKACCKWHNEDTPSLVWNSKENYWKCFGCSKVYDILDFYMNKEKLTYLGAVEKLFNEVGIKYKFGEKGVKTKREYKYPKYEYNSDRSKVERYLALRKIGQETLDYCDIQEDNRGNIVFNFYDTNDVLMTVKYRPSRKLQHGEVKAWCQQNADFTPLLFNMNRVDPTQPLLICEGEIDALSAIEAGFKNAVSIPIGANNYDWIEYNWDWLEQFDKVIIWSDNDEAGYKMRKNIIPRIGEWRCFVIDLPTELEKDNEKINVKDINEILYHFGKEAVLNYIDNAKEIPISHVVDFADVEDFDIDNADGIYTRIKELDGYLSKLFFGSFNIFTGINGCVDSETEYFNGFSWKKISQYDCEDKCNKVLQYNVDGTTSLVEPLQYIKQPCNEFYLIKSKYGVEQCVTKEHNMVYLSSKNNINKIKFSDMYDWHQKSLNGFYGKFITTFKTFGDQKIPLNEFELRLMVAVCADGHFPNGTNRCRVNLKRDRKKQRLEYLLEKCGIEYELKHHNPHDLEYNTYLFKAPIKFKIFPNEWYSAPEEQLKIIYDEVYYWDGCQRYKSFSSTVKENADFIQYVATVCGYRTTIYTDERLGRNECYDVRSTKTIYPTIKTCKRDDLKEKHIQPYHNHDGFKYCFTVPSGMLVLRRNGIINITGNSGKSTLLNQVGICESLDQGYDVMIYSGELPHWQLKNWITYNLSGRRHIETIKRPNQPDIYKIKPEIKQKISNHYRGRLFFYDNQEDRTAKSIINKMTELARKNGTKVFIIDNFTVVDLEANENNKWDKQKDFIVDLIKFATNYNVLVILVIHPHKLDTIRRMTKMDVQGVSAAIDLAHRIIGVHRVRPKEKEGIKNKKGEWITPPNPYDVMIDIFKDRLIGFEDVEIGNYYDRSSRRFWSDSEELDHQYSWDKGVYKEKLPNPREDMDGLPNL